MCADCPSAGVEKDRESQVLTPGGMESQTKPHRGEGVCQRGCGLLLSGLDVSKGEHCCVEALRTVADALEERSVTLEHEARIARLRWNRREQCLLAQVSTLQNQAQLDALKYQRRLNQYLVHIRSIAEQLAGYCKSDSSLAADMESKISDNEEMAQGQTKAHQVVCFFFFPNGFSNTLECWVAVHKTWFSILEEIHFAGKAMGLLSVWTMQLGD
uniref:Uncharacterized protein n=1 Tax=Astatotilapia calliptera TaxID=8154 RepID=A0AAX7VLS1_ASTCA